MDLDFYKNLAIIFASIFNIGGVIIALITYRTNVNSEISQRSIENAMRYWEITDRLLEKNGFIKSNIKEFEDGTYKRDLENKEMEVKFNDLLSSCEHVALLQNAGAVPKSINAYGFGWFAKRIYPILTAEEKSNKYWELAVDFLEETMKDSEKLDEMSREERLKYLKNNHFA